MIKDKMTDEQKYWYLKGYLESFIHSTSIDLGITENEIRRWLVNVFKEELKMNDF